MPAPFTNPFDRTGGFDVQAYLGGIDKANAEPITDPNTQLDANNWNRLVSARIDAVNRDHGEYYDVRDYGCQLDGVADDTAGFQACLAAAKADVADVAKPHVTGATLKIPLGVLLVTKQALYSVLIEDCTNIRIEGQGPGSCVRMSGSGGGGDWYMFSIQNTNTRISFHNLTIDGDYTNLTDLDEQTHLVNFSTPGAGDTTEVIFDQVWFIGAYGDAIRTIGAPGEQQDQIIASNCFFIDNQRVGFSVQRQTRRTIIANSLFAGGSDQLVDFEPTGSQSVFEFLIAGNIFLGDNRASKTVTFSGAGPAAPNLCSMFVSNQLIEGDFDAGSTSNILVAHNMILGSTGSLEPVVDFHGQNDNVKFSDNMVVCPIGVTKRLLNIAHQSSTYPTMCKVDGNHFTHHGTGGIVINVEGGQFVSINANSVYADGDGGYTGINVRTTGRDAKHIQINNNFIADVSSTTPMEVAIQFNASNGNAVRGAQVNNNYAAGVQVPLRFLSSGGGHYDTRPVVIGNAFDNDAVVTNAIGVAGLLDSGGSRVPLVISGNAGHVCTLFSTGSPEGLVSAPVGSQYIDDAGGAGTTMYIKESGTGATGWSAV